MRLSDELVWRGLIKDKTFEKNSWLDEPKIFYQGVDGSSDSLTIGNLAALMLARHMMNGGWKAIILIGGATSLIGDPGGKDKERPLPDKLAIHSNIEAIKKQIDKLFAKQRPVVVNNMDWLAELNLLEFLRDIGKSYSMTELVQRDFIAERMGKGGPGISYAEFSYTLIQGYDFWHLFKHHGVRLQTGGSDQWGNMLSGTTLIRKKEGKTVHALSMPLVINKATGRKFGKSEDGAIWLDPQKTSPTSFYQFWVNVEDEAATDYLKIFTLLSKEEVDEVITRHRRAPEKRMAQQLLAAKVTEMVHGRENAHTAEVVSNVLTGKTEVSLVSTGIIEHLRRELPSLTVPSGCNTVAALVSSGLANSNSEARRLMSEKAIYINNKPADKEKLVKSDFRSARLLIRRGKAYKDSALIELV